MTTGRLTKTLSRNAAALGVALLVIGGGTAGAALAASPSPSPQSPKASQQAAEATAKATAKATQKAAERAAEKAAEQAEDADEGEGARRTDTHGYCVSRVADTTPAEPTGTGADKVNHGSLVRAAAHACGKNSAGKGKPSTAGQPASPGSQGKAYGRGHGTGRPSSVPAPSTARP